jgi:hypothetical protein
MTMLAEIEITAVHVLAWLEQPQVLSDLQKVATSAAAAIAGMVNGQYVTATSAAVVGVEAAADALEDAKFGPAPATVTIVGNVGTVKA